MYIKFLKWLTRQLGVKQEVEYREETVVRVRFDSLTYRTLEARMSNTSISSSSTDIETAYKLGIQHCLREVRNGFTVGD